MAIEQSTAVERHHGISLDALILVLISGLRLHLNSFKETTFTTPALNAITVGLLGLYLALDILGRPLLAGAARSRRAMYAAKSAVLAAIIVLTVIWPTLNMIGLRHASQPWNDVHDTSINVEEATKFLLNGKDPYAQTYFKTPLAQFTWHSEPKYGYGLNPALWQTDIFPAQALLTVPFMLAAQDTVGWFDERFIYLLAFALAVVLLIRLAPSPSQRLALVAGVALNPLWVPNFIWGENDILVLAELLVVLWCSTTNRWRAALLALALACATKQTVLIFVPLYLWWLALRLAPSWPRRRRALLRLLPWLVIPFALMVGPFAVWDWKAFYAGNFGYIAGTVPHSYPIQGYDGWGAASFVLWGGLVSGPNDYYPFWVLQLAGTLPLLVPLWRRLTCETTQVALLGVYATVLFPIFYFSRFFHQNYLSFVVDLCLIAYLCRRRGQWSAADSHISFELVALLILVPQLIDPPTNQANGITVSITMGLIFAYMAVATLTPWTALTAAYARRQAVIARALVLAALAEITIFARGFGNVTSRLLWNAPATFIHDTALQIQIGAGELLKLHNPYSISFLGTPLVPLYIPPHARGDPIRGDLPLMHNPHLPLHFLIGAPLQGLFNLLGYLFDERYVYLFALLIVAILLPLLAQGPIRQLALLASVLFSPLFSTAVVLGHDDVLVLLALVGAMLLLQRGRSVAACLAVGIAVALKLTAWPLIPLLLAYLAGVDRGRALSLARRLGWVAARGLGLIGPLIATTLPFALWNARDLWEDAFAYPLGLMRDAIPLNQYWGQGFQTLGFGRIALGFGWAHLNGNGYIGPWLGAVCGIAILGLLVRRLWRAPSLPLLVGGYLVLLFALEYFGRFMIDTALGYLAVLAPLSFFLSAPSTVARLTLLPLPSPDEETAIAV